MFLDKISKELAEKERITQLKKKNKPANEEYLIDYSADESEDSSKKKKVDTKKVYPVCIAFH